MTDITGSGQGNEGIRTHNDPAWKLNQEIERASYYGTFAGDASNFAFNGGNLLTPEGFSSGTWSFMPIVAPEEAWGIDTKTAPFIASVIESTSRSDFSYRDISHERLAIQRFHADMAIERHFQQ